MEKKFIRFIVNTNQHPRGEKIKALNIITKIFDENDNLIKVKRPCLVAGEHQIEIDVEGTDYRQYLPLRHFKHYKGKIIKKSQSEIDNIEQIRATNKTTKESLLQQQEQNIAAAKQVINDKNKTDSEKLSALLDVLREEGIL